MATAPGIEERNKLRDSGFSADQIVEWETSTRDRLAKGGFSQQQVDGYFGGGKISDQAVMGLRDVQFPSVLGEDGLDDGSRQKEAEGFIQSLEAGFQGSVTGLQKRQALPELVIDDEANFVEVLGGAIGQFGGDLPVSLPSFLGGAGIGAGLGGGAGAAASKNPLASLFGGGFGAAVGGEATSGFVTEATRQALINFYGDNRNAGVEVDAKDFSNRLIASIFDIAVLKQGAKGGAVGAVTGATGGAGRIFLKPVIGNPALRQAVVSSAEVTTAVSASAALEGQLPRPQDFAAAGAIVLGLDVSIRVGGAAAKPINDAARAFEEHYVKTGERPEVAAERAQKDPVFRQQVLGDQREEGTVTIKNDIETTQDPTGIKPERQEPIVIDNLRDGPEAVAGAKKSQEKMGKTTHSAIIGGARPDMFEAVPPRKVDPVDPVAVARETIRSKIQPITKRRTTPRQVIDDIRFSLVNDLQFVVSQSEVAAKTATGKKLGIADNPGETMRLAFGAHARADLQVKFGIFDDDGNKVIRSYDEIVEGITDMDAFVEYMTSRRVLEKELQGFETGLDPTAADVIVKDADANTDFRARAAEVQEWNNATLFEGVDAGLFTRKEVTNMIAENADFVPYSRIMDEGKAPPGVSVRGFPVRKPTKKFKGSDKDILDPLEIMIKNKYMTLQIIENQKARLDLVAFNEALPDDAKMFTLAKKQLTKIEIAEGDSQVKKFLEDNGLNIEDATGLHLFRAANKALAKGDFIVFQEGKPVTYTARDPNLVLSLQQTDRVTKNILIKMMQVPSAFLRGGVTLNPEFSLTASFRDQLGAVLINDFTVVPFLDLFRGLIRLSPEITTGGAFKEFIGETSRTSASSAAARKIDKVVVQWINEGGANSAMLSLDKRSLSEAMSLTNSKSIRESAWNTALFPVRKAAVFATMMENGMRVARFERALKEGKSKKEAALNARDVNLDFGRMGADIRSWNMITTWLGPAINGIDRFNVAFARDPVGTTMKTAASITLPSMILYAWHKDELWFQELPEWERMLFWHFPIGGTKDDPEFVVRLPMPHQFGTIFGYLPTKLHEEFEKAHPEPGKAIRESLAAAYSVPLVPTAITPLAEISMNQSFFTGNPLVSRAQERILPEFQYTPHTTQLSRQLAQLLATVPGGVVSERFTSPIAIEHMVRGYGGTLGTLALQALDTNLKNAGFLEDINKPDPTLADNPVYGAFFSRNESARQSITDFYENAEDMERVVNTIRQEATRGNPEQIDRILRRRGFPGLKPGKVKQSLGNMRKMAYAIHFDKTMKGDEKRQLINELNKQQVAIAREFNDLTENFKRLEKERKKKK